VKCGTREKAHAAPHDQARIVVGHDRAQGKVWAAKNSPILASYSARHRRFCKYSLKTAHGRWFLSEPECRSLSRPAGLNDEGKGPSENRIAEQEFGTDVATVAAGW
jgi:hypothetical protein